MLIHLTELTSKRQSNCNGRVTGPSLFIKKKIHLSSFILKSYMLQPQLPSLLLQLSSLYFTRLPISTSSFQNRSLTYCMWAVANQAECLSTSSWKLFADQCFSKSSGSGSRREILRSIKKGYCRSRSERWERRLAKRG